jgi:hypothetical protein
MKRSAVRIDVERAAALIELPAEFHPLLAQALARTQARRDRGVQAGNPECLWNPLLSAIGRRELRIRDAVLRAAEARGYAICKGDDELLETWFVIGGERVDWDFRERYQYRPLRPAERERDPLERTQKNIAEPSGYLVLSIKADYSNKQEVHEKRGKLLETRIEEILQKIEAKAAHAAEQKNFWAERDRVRREREAQRRRTHILENREDERWRELCDMAAAWKQADELRAFVALVSARMDELEKRPVRANLWLDWARRSIDSLDPSCRDAQAVYDHFVRNPHLRRGGAALDSPEFDDEFDEL